MKWYRDRRLALGVAAFLVPIIFLIDLVTPLGFDVGLFYLIPAIVIAIVTERRVAYWSAALFSLLIIGGVFLTPPGIRFIYGLVNGVACVAVLWLAVLLLVQGRVAGEQHSRRLEILHEIDRAILAEQAPKAIAQVTVVRFRQALGCERAAVLLYDRERGQARVLAVDGEPVAGLPTGSGDRAVDPGPVALAQLRAGQHFRVPDLTTYEDAGPLYQAMRDGGLRSFEALPLMPGGNFTGMLTLASSRPSAFGGEDLALAQQVTDLLAVAIYNTNLFEDVQASREQLQQLSHHLVNVQDAERQAIARELHDEAGQVLTALIVQLQVLERDGACPASMLEGLREAKRTAQGVMDELHALVVNLRPASLDRLGLVPAVRQYAEQYSQQHGIEVRTEVVGLEDVRLPPDTETCLYRILQESLTNVARHAEATSVGVILSLDGDRVSVIIEDDGQGFDPEQTGPDRLGLVGMRERAVMLSGDMTVESVPGRGTTIFVNVPYLEASAPVNATVD